MNDERELDFMFKNMLEDFLGYDNSLTHMLKITKAYRLAKRLHNGVKRKSGEPYIIHPLEVAKLAITYKMDCDTICACILHDVVEDTSCTLDYIREEFGEDVANIVDGVTKLTNLDVKDEIGKEELFAKTVRKIFTGLLYKDIRIVAVKLLDRLHNMRTLEFMKPEKQVQKSKETLEIFAPLAQAIGANRIKKELEDISMRYLYPDLFNQFEEQLDFERTKSIGIVEETKDKLSDALNNSSIDHDINIREKNIYNVYNSFRKGRHFDTIHDLYALQIGVNSIPDCYSTLGVTHQYLYNNGFQFLPERFKDYIVMPKTTGYRALHTTLMVENQQLIQAQIRTQEMAITNTRGILDHLQKYSNKDLEELKRNYPFFSKGIMLDKEIKDDIEFYSKLKYEILGEHIYIRNLQGRTEELPVGSTLLDYAFLTIPSQAAKIKSAEINGQKYSLEQILNQQGIPLRTDDHIDFEFDHEDKISNEWVDKCATIGARKRILNDLK